MTATVESPGVTRSWRLRTGRTKDGGIQRSPTLFDYINTGKLVDVGNPSVLCFLAGLDIGMTYERIVEWEGKPATLHVANSGT